MTILEQQWRTIKNGSLQLRSQSTSGLAVTDAIMSTGKKITLALFVLFLFAAMDIFAQPYFDIVNIYYRQSPGKSLYHTGENRLKTELVSVNLQAAFKVKKDYIVVNPFCDYYNLRFSNGQQQEMYGLGIALTWLKQWKNEKWSTAFIAIPRLNSEMQMVNRNDYQLGGAVLGIYKKNETLAYKFGVYYNAEYFGPFVVPLVGIEWSPSNRLKVFGILPNQFNVEYKFNKHFYVGTELSFMTNTYRYENDSFLRIDDNHLRIYADVYFTKNIVLTLEAGQSAFRRYRIGYRTNGPPTYSNLNVDDGLLFRAGIAYRLRLDEKADP